MNKPSEEIEKAKDNNNIVKFCEWAKENGHGKVQIPMNVYDVFSEYLKSLPSSNAGQVTDIEAEAILADAMRLSYLRHGKDSWLSIARDIRTTLQQPSDAVEFAEWLNTLYHYEPKRVLYFPRRFDSTCMGLTTAELYKTFTEHKTK